MRYYLGPWDHQIVEGETHFLPPAGVIGLIDMRSIPGHAGQNYGFFVTPDNITLDPTSFELLGQGSYVDQITLTGTQAAMWSSMLGLQAISSTNLLDAIWESLTVKADPTGNMAVRPLMPTRQGNLELHLGGHSLVRSKRFDLGMPEAANVIKVLQEDYRDIRQRAIGGDAPAGHHRRVLDYWGEKFGVNNPQDIFIPNDLPREIPLPHATTHTESFNQTDSSTLGPDLTWTETTGDLETTSNRVNAVSGTFSEARAEHDVSGSDMYTQALIYHNGETAGTSQCRVMTRFSSSARTYYGGNARADDTDVIYKEIAGSFTSLVGPTAHTWSDGITLKIEANGSTITSYDNGASIQSTTDTAITGNTRGGLGAWNGAVQLDDFETGDIAAGGATASLTGISSTTGAGTITTVTGANFDLSGVSSTPSVGTLIAKGGANATITGVQAISAIGSLSVVTNAIVNINGVQSSTGLGTLSISGSANVSLAGIESTGGVGSLTIVLAGGVTVSLTGASSTGEIGSLIAKGGAITNLTGVETTSNVSAITSITGAAVTLNGVESTGQTGIFQVTTGANVQITGITATGQVGTLTISAGIGLNIETPNKRIYTIESEDRLLLIVEDRTLDITEDKIYPIQ